MDVNRQRAMKSLENRNVMHSDGTVFGVEGGKASSRERRRKLMIFFHPIGLRVYFTPWLDRANQID